jgi:hypothetical protein
MSCESEDCPLDLVPMGNRTTRRLGAIQPRTAGTNHEWRGEGAQAVRPNVRQFNGLRTRVRPLGV